jgi:hypothetical protein
VDTFGGEAIAMTRLPAPIVYGAFGAALLVALTPAIRVTLLPITPTLEQLLLMRCLGF